MIKELDRWQRVALGCGGAMFVVLGMGRFSYGAMVPALVLSGQVSADQVGWIGGANLAGFFGGAFISEIVRRKWRPEHSLVGAIVLSLIALLASALPFGAFWLGSWRGLLGLTAGLVMVQGLALTTAVAPDNQRPVATGLMLSGVGAGIFFSGILVPWLLKYGVFWAWAGIAAISIAAAIFAFLGLQAAGSLKMERSLRGKGILFVLRQGRVWGNLALAYFLFSFGITPHTLYWVDFIVRELALGTSTGGAHWAVAGFFSMLGPLALAWLARRMQTSWAVVASFFILGIGIILPALVTSISALWLSTIIFGTQPGVTAIKAARARDLGSAAVMPSVLRVMVMASSLGGAAGGLVFPAIFATTASYELMFLIAGTGILVGGCIVRPNREKIR